MKVTRLAPPSSPLIDNATIAQWLRIDASTDQATIDMLLGSAIDWIEGFTGHVLLQADYRIELTAQEYHCLDQDDWLYPISSIGAVTFTDRDGNAHAIASGSSFPQSDGTPLAGWFILGAPMPGNSDPTTVPRDALAVALNVTAGYQTPELVPAALRHAAAVLTGAGYDNRSALDPKTMATVTNLCTRYRRAWLAA